MDSKKKKIRFISSKKTEELQKDWQGYGRAYTWFGIVVLVIFIASVIYHCFI